MPAKTDTDHSVSPHGSDWEACSRDPKQSTVEKFLEELDFHSLEFASICEDKGRCLHFSWSLKMTQVREREGTVDQPELPAKMHVFLWGK